MYVISKKADGITYMYCGKKRGAPVFCWNFIGYGSNYTRFYKTRQMAERTLAKIKRWHKDAEVTEYEFECM